MESYQEITCFEQRKFQQKLITRYKGQLFGSYRPILWASNKIVKVDIE
jgi:hypothetical protein